MVDVISDDVEYFVIGGAKKNPELVKDAAGAMVRRVLTEEFIPAQNHHRMTREFKDFARMIDEKDFDSAEHYTSETLGVMKIVG